MQHFLKDVTAEVFQQNLKLIRLQTIDNGHRVQILQ